MANETMTVFGCEQDERCQFEACARRYGVKVRCVEDSIGHSNIVALARGSGVSVSHKAPVDARLIRALQGRGVSYLSSRSVGLDHIDRVAAKAAGIAVENAAYSPESVSEHTIMLMLMALRNAGSVLRRVGSRDFRLEERRALELRDMTVGVMGTGRIGKAVIKGLSGFGCSILAYDPHPSAHVAYVGIDELLEKSDLVTLHLPLTDGTRHLLDKARVARMRRGAILVNTARGALVDAQALADALEGGGIACAAMDVIEGEEGWFYRDCSGLPPPPFARLLALQNAIVTPHTAFYTEHALRDVVRSTMEGFVNFAGGAKKWVV